MEVATFGLDDAPGLPGIFLFPFRDDIEVGLHFEQAFEKQRETLRGGFLKVRTFT